MGFGHRIYKNYDPTGPNHPAGAPNKSSKSRAESELDIALELERIALEDDYFVKRKLYPNVDFYSGIIYQAMGFRPDMFTVLFAIPRTAGWLAQWEELVEIQSRRSPARGKSTPDMGSGNLSPSTSACRCRFQRNIPRVNFLETKKASSADEAFLRHRSASQWAGF